jgi:hypothetical protein
MISGREPFSERSTQAGNRATGVDPLPYVSNTLQPIMARENRASSASPVKCRLRPPA